MTQPVQAHAQHFKALADPMRLHILSLLQRQDGTLTVEELLDRLAIVDASIEQPTLSYHLKILTRAGITAYHRQGNFHYYYICPDACQKLVGLLEDYTESEVVL